MWIVYFPEALSHSAQASGRKDSVLNEATFQGSSETGTVGVQGPYARVSVGVRWQQHMPRVTMCSGRSVVLGIIACAVH